MKTERKKKRKTGDEVSTPKQAKQNKQESMVKLQTLPLSIVSTLENINELHVLLLETGTEFEINDIGNNQSS